MEIQKVEDREEIANKMEKGNMEEREQQRIRLVKVVKIIVLPEMVHNLKEEMERAKKVLAVWVNIVVEVMNIMVAAEEIGEINNLMVVEVQIIVKIMMEFLVGKQF